MIRINGADRVKGDGEASRNLFFRNTNSTPANTGATFLFMNICSGGELRNCIIENNGTSATSGSMPPPMAAVKTGAEENPIVSSKPASRVYPNPTSGSFTLEINEHDLTQELSAQICDLRGKKILDINLNGLSKQVISLENQPKGMYFIRLFSDEKFVTTKILKQ
jgi:hypothetical protein